MFCNKRIQTPKITCLKGDSAPCVSQVSLSHKHCQSFQTRVALDLIAFKTAFHLCCECCITVVTAYSMCKMSVTHGGVFAALQSSRHAHISQSFSLSPSLSLSDLLWRLDEEWEALSRKRTAASLAQALFDVSCTNLLLHHFPYENWASYTSWGGKRDGWGYSHRGG